MPTSPQALQKLVAQVGEFYITERGMKKSQERMAQALARGTVSEADVEAYLKAVRRYFSGFEAEARAHLRTLDKRLEQINQVHFNLTAERNVAVRRIEGTQTVLAELSELEPGAVRTQ